MEKIKLTEKEVEYLNDFVKMGRKICLTSVLFFHRIWLTHRFINLV
ncbi:MAG: hypothetical protein AEth_00208 [Candidatus Argoarchaeum ethanivorans]|uniref:Uncharacterized protein n=1 Tax=Candidatus Argoarchaeum ethanivorans TaxID=2608793 RepID=A0A8B3S6M7_9EURY|nr:MAG: hypothetical protein AEth_00208 [Candidatus Argoarchaeum ethanivorans]